MPSPFGAFEFTVHGRVQGVFFRKFTVAKAKALHLVGWCANSQRGTVVGECQGKPEALAEMKEWLCTEGSPHSHIERCEFKQERDLDQLQFETFERRPNVP